MHARPVGRLGCCVSRVGTHVSRMCVCLLGAKPFCNSSCLPCARFFSLVKTREKPDLLLSSPGLRVSLLPGKWVDDGEHHVLGWVGSQVDFFHAPKTCSDDMFCSFMRFLFSKPCVPPCPPILARDGPSPIFSAACYGVARKCPNARSAVARQCRTPPDDGRSCLQLRGKDQKGAVTRSLTGLGTAVYVPGGDDVFCVRAGCVEGGGGDGGMVDNLLVVILP